MAHARREIFKNVYTVILKPRMRGLPLRLPGSIVMICRYSTCSTVGADSSYERGLPRIDCFEFLVDDALNPAGFVAQMR